MNNGRIQQIITDILNSPALDGRANITIKARTIIIGHGNSHAPASPQPLTISEKQSRWLRALVLKIVAAERRKTPRFSPAKVWSQLNAEMGVNTHREIARGDFERAKTWLEAWLDRVA